MATARSIINPKNLGSIKFATTEGGLAASTEQGYQIAEASLVPKPNMSTAPGTFGAPPVDVPGATGYSLNIKYLQDWGLDANSLSEFLFAHDGEEYWFRIDPANANVKGMEGKCYLVAGQFGGPASANWDCTATFPCTVKPTLLAAT